MCLFDCKITREQVINIITQKIQNITNIVNELKENPTTFYITDGITTETISDEETINFLSNSDTKIIAEVTSENQVVFKIDTEGAVDGQILSFNETTEKLEWTSFSTLSTPNIKTGNTCYVSKLGNDATAERESITKQYLTIAAAITACQDGDTIIVYPGTYAEGALDLNALTGSTTGYNKFTIELIGDVIIEGSIVSDKFGINIIGPSAVINSTSATTLDLTGTSSRELKINLLKVQSNTANRAVTIDTFVGANLDIDYINNIHSGGSATLGTLKIENISTLKYKGISVYSTKSENTVIDIRTIPSLFLSLNSLTSPTHDKLIFLGDCKGDVTINKTKCSEEGFKITKSNLKIKNTNIEGVIGQGAIVQIEGYFADTTTIIFTNCIIEGFAASTTDSTRNIVNIGESGINTTDYCQIKFEGSTVINNNTSVMSGCLGLSGDCTSSNIILWFQNCHLYSASMSVMVMTSCGGGTYEGDSADVYYLGYNTANATVSAPGNTNFIGTLNVNAAFVNNIAIF